MSTFFFTAANDVAKLIIYPTSESLNAKPVLIYGAGTAGNELYQSIQQNPNIKVVGFFDNSFKLKGASINNIKIYGKQKHIKNLSEEYPSLEIYLAIPSLSISERRKIISSLEKYKIAVRSIPALHEIVANEKKMAEIHDFMVLGSSEFFDKSLTDLAAKELRRVVDFVKLANNQGEVELKAREIAARYDLSIWEV